VTENVIVNLVMCSHFPSHLLGQCEKSAKLSENGIFLEIRGKKNTGGSCGKIFSKFCMDASFEVPHPYPEYLSCILDPKGTSPENFDPFFGFFGVTRDKINC
jgi:hypothetical protein